MRRTLLALTLSIAFAAPLCAQHKPVQRVREELCATCYGNTPCNACKNCRYCKHCSGGGGTCGVCKPAEAPKPKPKKPNKKKQKPSH